MVWLNTQDELDPGTPYIINYAIITMNISAFADRIRLQLAEQFGRPWAKYWTIATESLRTHRWCAPAISTVTAPLR